MSLTGNWVAQATSGPWDLDACLRDKAKLRRAYGECLGNQKR
jgi:hypothetical protein